MNYLIQDVQEDYILVEFAGSLIARYDKKRDCFERYSPFEPHTRVLPEYVKDLDELKKWCIQQNLS